MVEAVVAIGIMTAGIVALAQLLAIATMNNRLARTTSMAAMLAQQKMEQLRGWSWARLPPSAQESLDESRDGCVDYLDQWGSPLAGGQAPPGGTAYVRRWSIAPLAADPANALVLQVRVTPLLPPTAVRGARAPGEARLVTIRMKRPG